MARERTPKLSRKGFRKKTGAGDMGIIAYHKAISGAIKRQPGGPNAPPPSALAQGGQLIQAAPSALVHFGLGAATDPIAGAGTGALIGGSIGSLAGGVGALPGALVGGLVGGAVGTVGAAGKWLFGDDDEPFETTKEVGSSIQRTAGRLVNPSRYLRASERGEIVGTIVEDLANVSIIAGGVKIGIGTVGGKGLAAASQLDRNITAALRAQAQHLAEADRLVAGASRVGVAEEQALALVGRAAEHAATAQTFGAQAAALGGKSAAAAARARPLMKAYRGAEAVERLGARGAFLPAKVWLLPGKVLPPAAKYFGPGLAAQIARAPWGESLVAAVHAGATRVASWKSGLQQRIKVRDETAQWAQKSDEIMEPINRATNEIYEVLPDELHQEAAILDHQRIGFVLTEVTRANPELLEPILNELTNAEGGVFATFTVEGLRMAIDVELRSRWEASGKGIPPEIEGRMPSDVYVRIRKAQEIYKTRVEAPLAVHHAQGTGRFERPFTAEARANAAWDITGEGPLPAAIAAMERRWDNIAGRVADRLDDAQKALDTVAKKEHWTAEEIADARKTIEVDLTEAVRLADELVQNNPAAVKDILKAANRNPKTKSSVVIALADLIYGAPAKGVVPGDGSHLGAALADGKWSDGALIPSAFGARLGHMTPVVRRAAQEGRVARLMAEAQDLRTRASNERSRGNKAEADLADARAEVVEGSVKKVQEAGENLETAQETYEHALDAAGELGVRQGKKARNAAHGVLRTEIARYRATIAYQTNKAAGGGGGITPESMAARADVVRNHKLRSDSGINVSELKEHLDRFDTAISSGEFERAEHHLIEAEYISQVIDVDAYNQITADREAAFVDQNLKARYEPIVGEAPAAAPAPGGITPESMAARAAELEPLTENGLDYNRGVVEHLGHYRRHIRQKAYGEAERELLHAEYLADVITWEQFQETLAERQATVKDFMDRYGNDSESLLAEHRARVAEINAKRRSNEMNPSEAGQARTAADTEYNARSNEGRKARRGLQEQAEQARYEPLVEGAEPPPAESAAPPIGDPLFMEGTVEEAILAIEADRGIVHPENALTRAELKTVADAVTNNLRPELPSIGLDRFGNPGFTPKINAVYHSIMNAVRRYSEASPEAPGTPTPAPTAALVKQLVNQFSRLGIRVGRAQGAAAGFGRVADVSERAAARTQQPATVLGEAAAESAARATASGLKKGFAAGERHRDVMRASQDVARLERQAANIPARREAALARERALIRNAPSRYRPALVAVSRARKVMNKAADQADQAVPGSGDVIRQALDDVPDTLERLVAGLGDTSRPAFYRGGKLPKYGAGNVGRSSEGMLPRTARATNEYRRQGVGGPASYREVAELNGQMVAQWMANESAHAIQARFGSSAASVLMTPDEGALFREVGDVLGDTDRFLVAANGDTAQARVAMVEELMDAGYVLIEMHRNVGASPGIAGKRTVTDVAVHHSLVTGRRIDPVKLSDAMAEKGYVPYAPEKLFLTETPTKVKVDTVFLPKPMFDAMRQQIGPVGKTEQMLRKVYDPALGVWKGSVLAYSPRWQVGNTVGNAIMATASTLINPVALFRGMNRGRRVIKAMHEGTVDRLPPELQSLANQVEPRLHQGSDSPAMRGGRVGEYETPRTSPLWRTKSGKRAGLIRRGANKMYALNGLVDDMNRIAVFEQQKKTLTLEQVADHASKDLSLAGRTYDQIHTEVAVRMSLKVAGAFNTLLPFERQVMKRIMPFYPWIRHITQLSYRLPKAHPMRVAWILHLADMFGEAPEFSFLEGAIPMDDEGWFFRLGGNLNPFADSAFGVDPSQLSGWRDLAPAIGGAISPAIQVPVQIATGLDMRTMMQTRRPAGTSQLDMYGREKASPFGVSEALLRIGDTMPQPRIGRALADELFGDGQILRYPTGQPIRSSGEDIPRVASGQSVPAGLMPILDLLGIPYPVKHDLAGLRVRRDERYRRDAAAEARYYGTSNAGGSGSLGGPKLSRKGFRKQSTRT